MDNLIGRKLDGRYLIESLLGVGGMANVYKGRDVRTGNAIAVKVLKEEFLDNEELVRRFKNESKAISILDHPNIVKVYDVSVTDQLQYIVMEYIDGITLKEYLKQRGGALTWKEVIHFATQVLGALEHAHSKGIVHRDVKPQNIMLQADGSIKMMDFGIARFSRAQSQTVSDKAIGSVHYISPEQAKGDRTDARTDIYSVGVMLYEMLSGSLPFDGSGTVSIAIMQISEKPKPLAQVAPNVPEGLRQITEKAMEKDPADRYQSAAEMLEAIQAFKQNPSIRFEYEYNTQDSPSKTINKVVTSSHSATKSGISTQQARRTGTIPPVGKGKGVKKSAARRGAAVKERRFSVLPIFFGMAVAFVIGAAILVYLIFTNSSNPLFSNRANVQLIDFVGQTEDEFRASDYFAQLTPDIVYEYNSMYPEGTIFQQTPAAGRTVKERQKITLKVSRGTEIISLPDVAGYDRDTAKQTLVDLGVSVSTRRETNDSVAETRSSAPNRRRAARSKAAPPSRCMWPSPPARPRPMCPRSRGLTRPPPAARSTRPTWSRPCVRSAAVCRKAPSSARARLPASRSRCTAWSCCRSRAACPRPPRLRPRSRRSTATPTRSSRNGGRTSATATASAAGRPATATFTASRAASCTTRDDGVYHKGHRRFLLCAHGQRRCRMPCPRDLPQTRRHAGGGG